MIYIAIVDDEKAFVQAYEKEVSRIFDELGYKCKIYTYTDSSIFLKETSEIKYDLIFLDIDMPNISGMEIAADLNKLENRASLIFVSNHSNFVFEAFRYSAYRFIRKDNLLFDTGEAISSFCNNLKRNKNHIVLDFEEKKNVSVDLSDIRYFFSIRHDIFFYNTQNKTVRLSMRTYTLDDLEKMLKESGFIRIHRTYLLNCLCIYQIRSDKVLLKDESELPISRRRYDNIKKAYREFVCKRGVL